MYSISEACTWQLSNYIYGLIYTETAPFFGCHHATWCLNYWLYTKGGFIVCKHLSQPSWHHSKKNPFSIDMHALHKLALWNPASFCNCLISPLPYIISILLSFLAWGLPNSVLLGEQLLVLHQQWNICSYLRGKLICNAWRARCY